MIRTAPVAALAAWLWAGQASGHEILHEVTRDKAIAVKAYFPDGEPLAYTEYRVFSPADPAIPHQKGRTDRDGYAAFVPSTPGAWRVVITDATGHGLDILVDANARPAAAPAPSLPAVAFILRPVVGVLAVAAVFTLLFLWQRRRTKGSRRS